ncbi:MAG: glycosyltransferase family 4 protein [Gemmatimonadaceae bacterium]
MRVALVVPGGVDASGTERVIPAFVWLIERLARRHDVRVFAMYQEPEPAEWDLLGARVENIGVTDGRRRRFLRRFGAAHRAAPFDVVHALFGTVGPLALLAARLHGLPFTMHFGGGELVALRDIGYGAVTMRGRLLFQLAALGAQRVTVATSFMQRLAHDAGMRAAIVPLGVALDRWPSRAPRPRDEGRPARLLHVGDLRPVKDQLMLLGAMERLAQHGVQFRLDVAGFDTMNGALQRSDRAARLGDRVKWHGLLDRAALRALVEEADLLVHTSRHEAGPLAVLEAAVAGVPTVGTAVGHVADWAPDAALAVPVGDAEALATGIVSLLTHEPRRLALALAAQERAILSDADMTATRFERIYEELRPRRPSTPSARALEVP